jgi:hypothetical protein
MVEKSMRDFCGFGRGSGATLCIKEFAPTQTWLEMLGYIQKDRGMIHFEMVTYKLTAEELEQARAAHAFNSTDPFAGRRELGKKNWAKAALQFRMAEFPLLLPRLDVCLL